MTILLQSDWQKYPEAIIHLSTRNKSFLEQAAAYRFAGIKNHSFFMALHNPALAEVDPFDPNLTIEQQADVAREARDNMWYYLRECVRVPAFVGNIAIEADRSNIALWWAFGMRITVGLQQIRQTRKSVHTNVLLSWLLNTGTTNLAGILTTKDEAVGKSHLFQIADIVSALPQYLKQTMQVKISQNNDHELTTDQLSNDLRLLVPQLSERRALNQARGLTFPLLVADDLPYQYNCHFSFPTMMTAMHAAGIRAHDDNKPYGVIIPTIAGKHDTPEGEFVYQLFSSFAKWDDAFFDTDSLGALYDQIRNLSPVGRYAVWIEMNHKDLGKTDEWLKDRIAECRQTGDFLQREYFNQWTGVPYVSEQAT
jgi:hypothetical protein